MNRSIHYIYIPKGGVLFMRKHIRKKLFRHGNHPVISKIALFTAAFLILKLAVGLGAEAAAEDMLKNIATDPDSVTDILRMELGGKSEGNSTFELLAAQSTLLDEITSLVLPTEDTAEPVINETVQKVIIQPDETPSYDYYKYSLDASEIQIKNKTEYKIEPSQLLTDELNIHIDPNSPQVLIIHTHGSEAYSPDGDDIYIASDPSRTEDKNYNVVRVGDRLTELLEERGISVLHDRELYDFPTYTGSYNRSLESIESYLEEYPNIKVVIDLHRDALESSDGSIINRTSAEINGEVCSQILLITGSNYSGLDHPNWQENLKFALHLQADMDEKYPGLTRPLTISQNRYNQHATTGSLIVEVGCTGNTLQESLIAVEYFADCLGDVLLRYSE